MSTMREVASRAGVSPATVSRVLNGQGGYGEETRRRVQAAIEALGYQPDSFARGLRTTRSEVIGLLARHVSDALASQVMQGVEQAARESGHAVMLGRTGSDADVVADYLRSLRNFRAAGVILISTVVQPEHRALFGTARPLISVAISDGSGSPSVAIDDERAAFDATRHLLGLGHRRIGLLAGDPTSVHVGLRRRRGYERAMAEAACPPVVAVGNFFYDSAAPGLDALLAQAPDLTAVFAVSDEMAVGVVHALQARGRRVPDDVSVLGFDDTATARHCHPALSTVAQPLEQMGAMAVHKILHPRDLGPRIVPHRLVLRGSTAPLHHPTTLTTTTLTKESR